MNNSLKSSVSLTRHKTTHHITIDDREVNCATARILKAMGGVNVDVKRLRMGDYEIDRRLLFERKSLVDFAASIKDGRLFRQAIKLASNPIKSVIILEGTAKDLVASKMSRESLQGALISISIIFGIPVLRARNPQESARLMLYAAQQVCSTEIRALPRMIKRPRGKRKIQLYLLQGLPGVGPVRAQRLIETFGSVEAIFTADTEDLAKIQGIGFRLAKAIRWAVNDSK